MNVKGNISVVNNISSIKNCLFRVTGMLLNCCPDLLFCVIWFLSNDMPLAVIRDINLYYPYRYACMP